MRADTRFRLIIATLTLSGGLCLVPSGQLLAQKARLPHTADAKTITHVLNRVTFGPRPGDVARVQAMGLDVFIDQQLHPEAIDDAAVDTRVSAWPTLTMSSKDLADAYFIPARQIRRQQQQQQPTGQQGASPTMSPEMMSDAPGSARPATGDPMAGPSGSSALPASRPAPDPEAGLSPAERAVLAGQRSVIGELSQARLLRAAVSERQLQEVMVDFWFNHFNVFVGKGQVRDYLTSYERDTIRPHVFGSFRELLGAVAHSPAMLFYLDNWQSASPNATPDLPPQLVERLNDPRLGPRQRQELLTRFQQMQAQRQAQQPRRPVRGLNENYARELMELHTLGVDGGYTQNDVINLARILTGSAIDRPQQGGGFVYRANMHDPGTKVLLGTTFAATGEDEGERALDLLARHPATAHHLAFKLSQRFVADVPPPALVDRVARVFVDTKGDIRQVLMALFSSKEFLAADTFRVKVKTPLEFVVSAVRATGATVTQSQPMVAALQNLGMPLFGCRPPTGYSMTADAWVNTGALLNRMNFAVSLVEGGRVQPQNQAGRGTPPPNGPGRGRLNGPAGQGPGLGPGPQPGQGPGRGLGQGPGRGRGGAGRGPLSVDFATLAPDTTTPTREAVERAFFGGPASETTSATLARAETPQQLVALAWDHLNFSADDVQARRANPRASGHSSQEFNA